MSALSFGAQGDARLALLHRMWRDHTQYHFIAVQDPNTGAFRNCVIAPNDDTDNVLAKIPTRGLNVFFACAEYSSEHGRKADNVKQVCAFFMDIDVGSDKAHKGLGYDTLEAAQAALSSFCEEASLPAPNAIVESGGGLHAYWLLNRPIDCATWKSFAQLLKATAKARSFFADPTRTADPASILRLPGTLNHKYSPPRPVQVVHLDAADVETNAFLECIKNAYSALEEVPKAAHIAYNQIVSDEDAERATGRVNTPVAELKALLEQIDPDLNYQNWTRVGMALFHETSGALQALELYDSWSKGGKKYKNRSEIEAKWRSFKKDVPRPVTAGTLHKLVRCAEEFEEQFTICETEVVAPDDAEITVAEKGQAEAQKRHPLERFSLTGLSDELARSLKDEVYVLDKIAISGQATMIFAAPNSGKTLLTLHLITDAITKNRIEPNQVYFINVDDTLKGLLVKVQIAEEFGFHMLGEGHRDFSANQFLDLLVEMTTSGAANGTVIVLDTVKRFTDMMDKSRSSNFTRIVRGFVLQGGTVIGLGHVNKNPGRDGRPVHSGTSDLVDDFDCAHILAEVERLPESNEKAVAFSCIKRRGNVSSEVAYRYSMRDKIHYNELFLSVKEIDKDDLCNIRSVAAERTDAELIEAVRTCITEGINTKMQLVRSVSERTKASHKAVIHVIEKYTGPDPESHHWFFEVRARGAKCFVLHKP